MADQAKIKSLNTKAYVQDKDGNVKELQVGDVVNVGDNIYAGGGAGRGYSPRTTK